MQTITENKNISPCGKYKLEIWHQSDFSENPFETWDGQSDLRVEYCRGIGDYSGRNTNVLDIIVNKFNDNYNLIIRHQKRLNEILGDCLDYAKQHLNVKKLTRDETINTIIDSIQESDSIKNEVLEQLCEIVKIPHRLFRSSGTSQGDAVDVLAVLSDEFFNSTGCKRRDSEIILDATEKLFEQWHNGEVFGFTIYEREDFVKIPKGDFDKQNFDNAESEIEWKQTDSCGGFYGDDFSTNGMCEHLPKELHEVAVFYHYSDYKC